MGKFDTKPTTAAAGVNTGANVSQQDISETPVEGKMPRIDPSAGHGASVGENMSMVGRRVAALETAGRPALNLADRVPYAFDRMLGDN